MALSSKMRKLDANCIKHFARFELDSSHAMQVKQMRGSLVLLAVTLTLAFALD